MECCYGMCVRDVERRRKKLKRVEFEMNRRENEFLKRKERYERCMNKFMTLYKDCVNLRKVENGIKELVCQKNVSPSKVLCGVSQLYCNYWKDG